MTEGTVIFDGTHLRAVLFAGGDGGLAVTFDFRAVGKAGFAPPNRSRSFAARGYAQLSIRSAANDWFINPETTALETALADLAAQYAPVHLLGYSMGGYGAFRFARALGAATVVAVSPQASIAPAVVPFDRRYRAEGAGFDADLGDLVPRALPGLQGAILFDPFVRPDLRHALMLQRLFPGVALARLPFGGHPALQVLRQAGKAGLIQRAALQNPPDVTGLIRAHRDGRRTSPNYWTRLAARAAARRPTLARAALDRAEALTPEADDGSQA